MVGVGAALLAFAVTIVLIATRARDPVVSFTDPTGHFSAVYEQRPVEYSEDTPVNGGSMTATLWSDTIDSNSTEGIEYASMPSDFTSGGISAALDASVNGEVSYTGGKLLSKTVGTYQGFPSVDAEISLLGGYLETRVVLAGRTMYIVLVTSTHDPPDRFNDFANSLHILGHGTSGEGSV